jgi:hypothetical protein
MASIRSIALRALVVLACSSALAEPVRAQNVGQDPAADTLVGNPKSLWCADTMIVVPDGSLGRAVYAEAIAFWQREIPSLTFVIRDSVDALSRAYTLPFLWSQYTEEQRNACRQGTRCDWGWFAEGAAAPRSGLQGQACHVGSSILIYDPLYNQRFEWQVELITHEIGHALGLVHRNGTMMQSSGQVRFLDPQQRAWLRAMYGKP